jgi:hypothetical protein
LDKRVMVSPSDSMLVQCVDEAARVTDKPFRPVLLQGLLQLPRLAGFDAYVPFDSAKTLLIALASELPQRIEWLVHSDASSPRQLQFRMVNSDHADQVMDRFHYLRSIRDDGRAYGLFLPAPSSQLVALCVSSHLDVHRIESLLCVSGRLPQTTRVISRVFAFEGAPANTISYLLSKTSRAEKERGVADLVTYVNPNLGFTGSSYRASNWTLLGDEPGTSYRYLDGRYITDRRLYGLYGRHSDAGLQQLLGSRFSRSAMPLAPLLVFHRVIEGRSATMEQAKIDSRVSDSSFNK